MSHAELRHRDNPNVLSKCTIISFGRADERPRNSAHIEGDVPGPSNKGALFTPISGVVTIKGVSALTSDVELWLTRTTG